MIINHTETWSCFDFFLPKLTISSAPSSEQEEEPTIESILIPSSSSSIISSSTRAISVLLIPRVLMDDADSYMSAYFWDGSISPVPDLLGDFIASSGFLGTPTMMVSFFLRSFRFVDLLLGRFSAKDRCCIYSFCSKVVARECYSMSSSGVGCRMNGCIC